MEGGEYDSLCGAHGLVGFERGRIWEECVDSRYKAACLTPQYDKALMKTGTGGVSMFALKLARAAGLKVVLSSSSDAKLENMRERFSSPPLLTVNYATNPNWHEEVLKLTGGDGVDLVIENGGTSSLVESLKSTRRGGTISQVGYLGKPDLNALADLLPLLIDRRVNLR
jgi:NADPH:quinone reductase-like Zn-dependent oxidoreductase